MLQAIWHLTHIWAWFPLILLSFPIRTQAQSSQRNITVPSDAPQIVYTPFVCDVSSGSANTGKECDGAWQVISLKDATFVSTNGPAPGVDIVPQMFFRFRGANPQSSKLSRNTDILWRSKASAFYLSTSSLSNATTNITVSNNGTTSAAAFNSSVGIVSVYNLPESTISTVAITFIPDASPTRLDIGDIILTVAGEPVTSIIFPTETLPPTASLPTFGTPSPTSAPTPVQASSNRRLIAQAVGITLGLSLGLTTVAVLLYVFWRHRRRRRPPGDSDSETSRSTTHPPWPRVACPPTLAVGADYQTRWSGRSEKKWFRRWT
ncbi:hypothetical protein D9615_006494 [Tricholomella constricta]|uniref:Uncharacterized protein n=1 Tax=Tricholomella constricta TaxID=117010 RepID=A0A8H5HA27_9AGAR|nr:hypothetical protein D9615_006494 [Tricholomella constricta]